MLKIYEDSKFLIEKGMTCLFGRPKYSNEQFVMDSTLVEHLIGKIRRQRRIISGFYNKKYSVRHRTIKRKTA